MTMNELDYVRSTVRQVPDFPKPGILFLDITTATKDAKSMNLMIDFLVEKFKELYASIEELSLTSCAVIKLTVVELSADNRDNSSFISAIVFFE